MHGEARRTGQPMRVLKEHSEYLPNIYPINTLQNISVVIILC